ncbi:hypothetical protein ACO1J7_15340 [Leptospira interrogans serovar Australis]|uniref:Uncharacterized protein n=2 Tax=Leptospira interrogans TaxID=173 RepID=A0A829DCS0_LEPIR|nr:hypothetical protein LEP1GSC027_4571 [Leptospira interrogans str. 2002000624]EKQ46916.1 hypothetical protein LEP1GSC026_3985 [Leptospira interrogans str. 2002000623]EMY07000.1 hypothetical protein LEP1GSC029_0911 [Leptospira interrogans str. 2002000626]EMY23486.1 hypothetical protein LEP1GSC115_2637 [Leptospira interrogans serovar Australis str. 200703203]
MHRSLRVALQVALENSAQRFPMGRVVEWKLVLQRICCNSEDLY